MKLREMFPMAPKCDRKFLVSKFKKKTTTKKLFLLIILGTKLREVFNASTVLLEWRIEERKERK